MLKRLKHMLLPPYAKAAPTAFYRRDIGTMDVMHPMGPLSFRGETPRTAMHVGANTGQEFDAYRRYDFEQVTYVEPLPSAFKELTRRVNGHNGHLAVQALCMAQGGESVTLHVSNKGGLSSSVLGLGNVNTLHPEIEYVDHVETISTTVDEIVEEKLGGTAPELLILDTQGTEAEVLRGARKALTGRTRYVFCEISHRPLYENGCDESEITAILDEHGFVMIFKLLNRKGWGDALYVREQEA